MLSNGVNAASTDLLLYDQIPKNNPKMKDTGAVPNRAQGTFEDNTAKKLAKKKARQRNANK